MQRHAHDELLVGVDDLDVAARNQVPAVAQVFQSDARRRFGFDLRHLGIGDHQPPLLGADRDMERLAAGYGIVFDGVADQRLQRQRRECPGAVLVVDVDVEEQFVGIAYFKEVAVRFDEFQFLVERHQRALAVLDDVAERIRQLVDVGQRLVVVLLAHEHRQRIERIEEEVGVDLSHEHVVAGREVLVLEPLVLHDDGLLLRIEHVDPAVEHRHRHGERTLQQQHVVENMVAHAVQHDASRTPLRDRRDHIQRGGGQHAPYAVAHEAARRVPAADGGED